MLLISILSAQNEINWHAPAPGFFNFEIPESEVLGTHSSAPLVHRPGLAATVNRNKCIKSPSP